MRLHELLLDPVTYNDVVFMAQKIKPESGKTLRDKLKNLLAGRVIEALDRFDANEFDIMREAFPDECEAEETGMSPEEIESLAKDIYDFLVANDLWFDTAIYFNGKRWSTFFTAGTGKNMTEDKADPKDYTEYVGDILTMTFEGPLYYLLNCSGGELAEQFRKIFKNHGCYFELGEAWNLTAALL